jgi:hypothetical protein
MLDIFQSNAFGIISMTDAINKQPFVPGRIGAMGLFRERGVTTIDIAIEEKEGKLYLVPALARGAPPTQNAKAGRNLRVLRARHLPIGDSLNADEVQGVRAFGSETALQTIQGQIDEKMAQMKQAIEATLEFHRIGAIKGIVLDADGTTTLYNLFTEFGITAYSTVEFGFNAGDANLGVLRKQCAGIVRDIANALGSATITGIHAICGDNFFDDLLQNAEVRDSYKNTPMASVLRDGYVYPNGLMIYGAFEFGGIVWENYRGSVGSVSFVDTDLCHIFPVGVPGLFETTFSPANYIETVNTVGLPVYAKVTPDLKNTHVDIDVQSNPLVYCTRPKALITGTRST